MAYQFIRIGAVASAIVAAGLIAGCNPSISSMSCDRIAEEAKTISQGQQYKINSISNLRELSRTEQEARCQGNAAWNDNSNSDIYLRAYEQSGNTMVAYQTRPFDGAGAGPAAPQPQGAPPPQQTPPAQGGVPGYDQPAQPQGGQGQQ
jgi:hypothetical protein